MNGSLISLLIAFMLCGTACAATVQVCTQGCPYDTISQAIDQAAPGDVIEVFSKTYYETVNVSESVTLLGIDTGNGKPVIDSGAKASAVTLSADEARVEGFVITGSGMFPGIDVLASGCTVNANDVSRGNRDGIRLFRASNSVISNNTLSYNGLAGVHIERSNNNLISNNIASHNSRNGIILKESSSNRILKNTVENNGNNGIFLDHSGNNWILENRADSNSNYAVQVMHSGNNVVAQNSASYSVVGISMDFADTCRIENNTATGNSQYAIRLKSSSNNVLTGNILWDNGRGNAYDDGETNQWYSAQINRGNRYDDFDQPSKGCTDLDQNGLCDTSYPIPGGSAVDLYPLAAS